jgi:nucleoside-triphosphatase
MKAGTVLLVAGRPGVGKTTVIRKVADALPRESLAGFYTEEVREHGRRRGFRAVTFDGWTRIIADVDHPGPARVGRYGVDVAAIDALVERSLSASADDALFLIDEVGKMECHSASFVAAMRRLLSSSIPQVVTVAERGGGFIAEVRGLRGAELWHVTRENRDALPRRVLQWSQSCAVARHRSASYRDRSGAARGRLPPGLRRRRHPRRRARPGRPHEPAR